MRRLLFLFILYKMLPSSDAINGVIWSKTQQTFVPIFSIPAYAMMQQEQFRQSRELETYNFQLQNLTLTSFQEPHFFTFHANNTKVSGYCGEIWNLLSKTLNFTLQPVRANVSSLGIPDNNFTFDGLLAIIARNETIAIPKLETFRTQLKAVRFTLPYGMNKQYLYIRREMMPDNTWMIKVFSWKIWCSIFVMHILLSICTFLTEKISMQTEHKCTNARFSEHLFYNFGNLCNQGYIPESLARRSRMLEVSLGFFCSVLYMAFGAVLFIYVTRSISVPPFDSFESLVANTKYNVLTMKGSSGEIGFKLITNKSFNQARKEKRLIVTPKIEDMHKKACSLQRKKYAIFQGEDEYKVTGHIVCKLNRTGKPYWKMWIASGIARNFKYKRSVDLGILKLMEVGLLNALQDRYLEPRIKHNGDDNTLQPIEIYQVSLVIAVLCCGMIIAIIVLIIEKIIFVYKLKQL